VATAFGRICATSPMLATCSILNFIHSISNGHKTLSSQRGSDRTCQSTDRTCYMWCPVWVEKGSRERFRQPDTSGRMWADAPPHPIKPSLRAALLVAWPDASVPWVIGCSGHKPSHFAPARLPVELTGRARRVRSSIRSRIRSPQWLPFASISLPLAQWKIDVLLPQKHKCANTTKCSPSCAHVLAYSQIFFQGVSISLDPKCICSRIWT
jgi:hypothetical protein